MLLSVIDDAKQGLDPKSRRYHIVSDVIEHNDYKRISEEKANRLKGLMKDYKGMTTKLRSELERLGFVITEDGSHYKLTYFGDGRYTTIYAKTPSDQRSGRNNAATTNRLVF